MDRARPAELAAPVRRDSISVTPPLETSPAPRADHDVSGEFAFPGDDAPADTSQFALEAQKSARIYGDPFQRLEDLIALEPRGEYGVERRRHIIFTPVMFTVCLVLFIWEMGMNDWTFEPLSVNPMVGPSLDTLLTCGAKDTTLILDGQAWRLWTAMFLHAGIVHFIFNMIGFLQVGIMVERVYGWWRVALIYLIGGLFSTIVSAVFAPLQIMVGASGAIFAVFGALWADLWQNWDIYENRRSAVCMLFFLTLINVILGLMPYLDNFAHISGLFMGFFLGLLLLVQKREDELGNPVAKKPYQAALQMFALLAVPALYIIFLALLFGNANLEAMCPNCYKMSCVEFPPSNPWWSCDDCSLYGFSGTYFSNGTTALTCPDESKLWVDDCAGASTDALATCCREHCLS